MILEEVHQTQFGLEQSDSAANAIVGTQAEGLVGHGLNRFAFLGRETFGIKPIRIGPVLYKRWLIRA